MADADAATGALGLVLTLLIVVVCIALYFLPSIIAASRHKRNETAIVVLNLVLGWTLIGWVVALVWSVTVDPPDSPPRARLAPPILCANCGRYSVTGSLFCSSCGGQLLAS
jgi:RsiW-degrading membrane proteinase PrsW (M82 family)